METVVVEHHFENRLFDIEKYKKAQLDGGWCLKQHGVHHLRSYLSPDKRRMICIFEAPDAEAVRTVAVRLLLRPALESDGRPMTSPGPQRLAIVRTPAGPVEETDMTSRRAHYCQP